MNQSEFKANLKMLGWSIYYNNTGDLIWRENNRLRWVQFKLLKNEVTLYGCTVIEGTYSYKKALQVILSWQK